MKKKIAREINEIKREHSRLKDNVCDDILELSAENRSLNGKVDALIDAHRRNTILFLVILVIAFVCHLYFSLRNR